MPDPFQLSAQINAPSVQDFSALQSKMDALRSGVQPMQGAAQVDDGWGAVDQSLNIAPKMPVLPPVPSNNQGMMFPNADGSHFDVKPRGQKLITQVADNQFQRDFDQAEVERQARVNAIKARAAQEDRAVPPGVVMYNFNGGFDSATDWSINGVMSPEETARRFKRYMTDNNATSDQAKAYFEDQALRAEARHVYNANQRLLLEGRPPINSFNRQKFLDAHRKAYNY